MQLQHNEKNALDLDWILENIYAFSSRCYRKQFPNGNIPSILYITIFFLKCSSVYSIHTMKVNGVQSRFVLNSQQNI